MKPIIQKRDKNLSVSVFVNQTPDGKQYNSIQLQRSFKKKGAQDWTRETINLFKEDLLPLAQIVSDTYTRLTEEEAISKVVQAQEKQDKPFDDAIPL